MTIQEQLEDLQARDLIYPRGGAVVVETIVERDFPDLNIDLLCTLLGDNLFDWSAAIDEYVRSC